jgi:hypothetical protein
MESLDYNFIFVLIVEQHSPFWEVLHTNSRGVGTNGISSDHGPLYSSYRRW